MELFKKVQDALVEILDVEEKEVKEETYVVRDLDAESIDFLEIAVVLGSACSIQVKDEEVFLRRMRPFLIEAKEKGQAAKDCMLEKYPFLNEARVEEMLNDLEGGPVLKVKDLISYLSWKQA